MQLARWGNSLALRIPASIVELLGLKEGDNIEVNVAGTHRFEIDRDRSREKLVERMRMLRKPLPAGWRFDRDDANER